MPNERIMVTKSKITNIADAIREKTSTSEEYQLDDMPEAIRNIEGGITPSGEIEITENGTYNVTNYATAEVNVSGGGGDSLYSFLSVNLGDTGSNIISVTAHEVED